MQKHSKTCSLNLRDVQTLKTVLGYWQFHVLNSQIWQKTESSHRKVKGWKTYGFNFIVDTAFNIDNGLLVIHNLLLFLFKSQLIWIICDLTKLCQELLLSEFHHGRTKILCQGVLGMLNFKQCSIFGKCVFLRNSEDDNNIWKLGNSAKSKYKSHSNKEILLPEMDTGSEAVLWNHKASSAQLAPSGKGQNTGLVLMLCRGGMGEQK